MASRNNLKPIEKLNRLQKQNAVDRLRRFGDLVIAATFLAIVAPLFLLVAIAIKWEGPGPVFERRTYIGRCRRFDKLEFRTTVYDPEQLIPLWVRRLTPVGELLRYTRIDALPQIVNVLRGEMSLIDPDGDLPSFLD